MLCTDLFDHLSYCLICYMLCIYLLNKYNFTRSVFNRIANVCKLEIEWDQQVGGGGGHKNSNIELRIHII